MTKLDALRNYTILINRTYHIYGNGTPEHFVASQRFARLVKQTLADPQATAVFQDAAHYAENWYV